MKLGIVAALPREAQTILPSAQRCSQIYSFGEDAWLAIAGEGAENAQRACTRLLSTGVTALLSWGIAAALDPHLQAGTLLLPDKVIDGMATAGSKRKSVYPIDKNWRTLLLNNLEGRFPVCRDQLMSMDQPLGNTKKKQQLYEESKACAVDGESVAIARCARDAGLAFAVIRVVAAPASLRSVRIADERGNLPLQDALTGLVLKPHHIPAFLKRSLYSRYALNVLRRAVLALDGRLADASA